MVTDATVKEATVKDATVTKMAVTRSRCACPATPLAALTLLIVLALATLAAGCREPTEIVPALELRAASADSSHIEIEFPEALDPIAMSDTTNYRVEMPLRGAIPRFFEVRRAAVVDSVRGRCLRLETAPIPDGVSLVVWVRTIRLLTGPRLGRKETAVPMVTGLSYGKDMSPLLASSCNRCHSGDVPAGEYKTDNYYSLFGAGTSPPEDLLPGNSACLLIVKCQPGASMFHQGGLEVMDADMIRNWVVSYLARP